MLKEKVKKINGFLQYIIGIFAISVLDFIFSNHDNNQKMYNIYHIVGTILFFLSLLGWIITIVISRYLDYKEISSGPLNNESGKNLNKLLKRYAKFLKKYSNNLSKYDKFNIKIPTFDFSVSNNNKRFTFDKKTIDLNNRNVHTTKICNTIMSLKRILLEINKSSLRIKFGQFVVNNSTNINQKIESYIDLLGWSKLLNGNSDGIKDINEGIKKCEGIILDSKNPISNQAKIYYNFQIIRAYRHLATTYYTYKIDKDNIKLNINKAFNYLSQLTNLSSDDEKQYTRLAVGLKYNSILFDYYEYLYNNKTNMNIIKDNIKNLYDSIYSNNNISLYTAINENNLNSNYLNINFIDNHRKIKICSLYAIIFDKNSSKIPLIEVEKILDNNIYIDEAIELYIYSKFKK